MKKKSAFTLIELLVVVAIIAILAALLFPNLTPILERARAAECANNLRSMGNDVHHYLTDSGGAYFQASSTDQWPNLLYNYSKDWKHFRSPFDRVTSSRPRNFDQVPVPISYGINEKLFDTFNGKWKTSEAAIIQAAPALDYASAIEVKFKAAAFSDQSLTITSPGGSGTPGGNSLGTHQKRQRLNVLFADGHVDQMEWSKFADNTTERGKAQWDPMY